MFPGESNGSLIVVVKPAKMNLRVLDGVEDVDVALEIVAETVSARVKRVRRDDQRVVAALAFEGPQILERAQTRGIALRYVVGQDITAIDVPFHRADEKKTFVACVVENAVIF